MVLKIEPVGDGRLFVSVKRDATVGYVLDPASLTATPIIVDDDWSRLRDGNAKTFDGRYLVLDGGWTPELVLARTELVVRPVGEQGSD